MNDACWFTLPTITNGPQGITINIQRTYFAFMSPYPYRITGMLNQNCKENNACSYLEVMQSHLRCSLDVFIRH